MANSPTVRSLAECKKRGWQAQVVEKWVAQARRRIDLWGVGDIIALDGKPGSLLIQASSASGHSARVKKSLAEPRLRAWLAADNRFEVWTWGKRGSAGKRKLWTLRQEEITHERHEAESEGCGASAPY